MEKELSREELVEKLNTLRDELSEVRSKIENLDSGDKIEKLSQYVGKCFKTREESEFINCCYVYEINRSENTNICLSAINVFHYDDKNYFGVKHDDMFLYEVLNNNASISWLYDNNETSEFIEITKEEFDKHSDLVMNLIKCKNAFY